jgi:preprotein translocase subunit SecE
MPASGAPGAQSGGLMGAYKPGEGMMTRLGSFLCVLSFAAFSAHHWFYDWTLARKVVVKFFSAISMGALVEWTEDPSTARIIAYGGVFALLIGLSWVGYYFIYQRPRTSEFLVQTDGELRKVTWPEITPWFKPEAKVWGVTYVVMIVLLVLTVYIFAVDFFFKEITHWLFYS